MSVTTRIVHGALSGLCTLMAAACGGCQAPARPAPQAIVASALASGSYSQHMREAKEFFFAAVAGDREALPKAEQLLEDLGGAQSRDPQVVAYLGGCRLFDA